MKRLLILLSFPIFAHSQDISPVLDKYMKAQFSINEFSGAVLVAKKGTILYNKAFGKADREWNIDNASSTKFRIGSLTKQFTAACIMKLEEEGKLSVTDPLSKYIADYPKGDSVTIHMLLNHTSGIANYTSLEDFWKSTAYLQLKPDSFINVFKNKAYDFAPGSNWSYSNSNYYLLGIVIERVSGMSYSEYLYKNIISPAGLKNTDIDRLDSVLLYRAKGYYKRDGVYRNAPYISMEGPWAAGALYSTTSDLYRWSDLLLHNKVVSASSVKKMATPYKANYGYGLMSDSLGDHPRILHNGGIPGFSSLLAYYPGDELYVVVISNNSSNATDIGAGLARLLFRMPQELPYAHKEIKLSDSLLARFVGKYTGSAPFEIINKGGKLYRRRPQARDVELKPESATRVFAGDGSDRQIEIVVGKDGKVTKAFLISSGVKTEMVKE